MNHIIDLEYILITHSEQAIIDTLYEHACELNCQEIVSMIEEHWQSEVDKLTEEECRGAQERSIKEQFGND